MPKYEIEQYELHAMKFRVEATSEAEAIAKLLEGEADPVTDSLEFIEIPEEYGLSVDENQDIAEELQKLGVKVGEHVISTIRSIMEVE
jgi:hypothetical protein